MDKTFKCYHCEEETEISPVYPEESCRCGGEMYEVKQSPETPEAVVRLNNLLNSLVFEKEQYEKDCATDNPDHWSRGYNNGCLKTVKRLIRKLKQAI